MSILVATAGHIDHGKSSLVRALTGMDPDRLPEEKARGITIVPGYAHCALPDGEILSFVDVPGHERFCDHMIQGASGITRILLVVAADDGVMPQTYEHLEVARLLGMAGGAVVLSKVDLVEPDWLDLVADDVHTLTEGTFLEGAPLLHFSAERPDEVDGFRRSLGSALAAVDDRQRLRRGRRPRMSIDRRLNIAGRGLVLTGTLVGGSVEVGDELEVHPAEARGRVRGMQVHGAPVDVATAPTRLAIDLVGVDASAAGVGAILSAEGGSVRSDADWIGTLVAARGLAEPLELPLVGMLHAGTSSAVARLGRLDPDASPSTQDEIVVRITLDRAVALAPDMRFILRSSAMSGRAGRTIGGGRLLLCGPAARGVRPRRDAAALAALGSTSLPSRIQGLLALHRPPCLSVAAVARWLDRRDGEVAEARSPDLVAAEPWIVAPASHQAARDALVAACRAHHERRPQDAGLPRAAVRKVLASTLAAPLDDALLTGLEAEGAIVCDGPSIRLPHHEPVLPPALQAVLGRALQLLAEAGLAAPLEKELCRRLEAEPSAVRDALAAGLREGALVRVASDYVVAAPAHRALLEDVRRHLADQGELRVEDLRGLTGLSRKYLVPLLEDLDTRRITRRDGPDRRVPGPAAR